MKPVKSVEVIPGYSGKKSGNAGFRRLRVAAYCRVSTATEQQESSIDNQYEHYASYIASRPDWVLAGIYSEAGVSGTKQEGRPELQRLLSDCEAGRIDLILTKSISRFARNTTECLAMVRKLSALGVKICFEKENIRTDTMESELMLTLFSSMAEAESHSISSNSTWAIRRRFQNGSYKYSKAPYGYRLENGNFVVEPEEAVTVREIFAMVLEGNGTVLIAKELNRRGIPTGTRKRDGTPGTWSASMIQGVITNVVYTGDALMQKTWHDRSFRLRQNYGERPQYYVSGHHEAIIERSVFELAKAANRQRGEEKGTRPKERKPQIEPVPEQENRHCLSGKLVCGCCGSGMKRITQTTAGGRRYHWCCTRHLEDAGMCPSKRVAEEDILNCFATMMNKLNYGADALAYIYRSAERAKDGMVHEEQISELKERIVECTKERFQLSRKLSKGCYDPDSLTRRIMELQGEEQFLKDMAEKLGGRSSRDDKLKELKAGIRDWQTGMPGESGTEQLIRKLTDHITVRPDREMLFHLKCGLTFKENCSM